MKWWALMLGLVACDGLRTAATTAPDAGSAPTTPPTTAPTKTSEAQRNAAGTADASVFVPVPDGGAAPTDPSPPPTCDGGLCPPETVADVLESTALASDGTDIFFSDENDGLVQCPASGCSEGRVVLAPDGMNQLLVLGGTLYWPSNEEIRSCAVGGCKSSPTTVIAEPSDVGLLATDGTNLYWTLADALVACPLATCSTNTTQTLTTNASTESPVVIAVNTVFWADKNTGMYSCPTSGCTQPAEITGAIVADLSTDGTNLFWQEQGSEIWTCPAASCTSPVVFARSTEPEEPTSDGVDVYWTDDHDHAIYRCPVIGCPAAGPELIVKVRDGVYVAGLTINEDYIYWETLDNVERLRKH